jgi:hypothetical protein
LEVRKETLAIVLSRAAAGIRLNEHLEHEDGALDDHGSDQPPPTCNLPIDQACCAEHAKAAAGTDREGPQCEPHSLEGKTGVDETERRGPGCRLWAETFQLPLQPADQ